MAYTDPTGNAYDGTQDGFGDSDDGSNHGGNSSASESSDGSGDIDDDACPNCDVYDDEHDLLCICITESPPAEGEDEPGTGEDNDGGDPGDITVDSTSDGGGEGNNGGSSNGGIETSDPGGGTGGGNNGPAPVDGITTEDIINVIGVIAAVAPIPQVKAVAIVVKVGLRYGPKVARQVGKWGGGLGRGKQSAYGPKSGSAGGPGQGKNFSQSVKDAERAASGNKCVFCGVENNTKPKTTSSEIKH